MKVDETIKCLDDKELLDKLYGFCYKRCSSSEEAEDLCSDIILSVLKSLRKNTDICSFNAFVWTVARRTYADFCKKRRIRRDNIISDNFSDDVINIKTDPISDFLEKDTEIMLLKKIKQEIGFLAKMYRDVMIMYYLDEMKICEIALKLGIKETTVKQRLFTARRTVKKEVGNMDSKNLMLKPIQMIFHGDGDPVKSYPFENANRTFSQSVLYLCKDTPRTAKEISSLLNVPMLFVEEELEIQCRGSNGTDGLLKKLDNGKYISTFIMLDYSDYKEVHNTLIKYLDKYVDKIALHIESKKEEILAFPFLNKQEDFRFILWSLIARMCYSMGWELSEKIKSKYYSDIEPDKKDYYPFAFVTKPDSGCFVESYGLDGIDGDNICGYSHVYFCNIYGKRKLPHFHCGFNISTSDQIQLTIRAIGGIEASSLSKKEKETAAKAIENGYIVKKDSMLYPKILVIPQEHINEFYGFTNSFSESIKEFAENLSEEFNELIKKYLPKYLYGQVGKFINHTTCGFTSEVIEKCIERGILYAPENPICAEGTFMVVQK